MSYIGRNDDNYLSQKAYNAILEDIISGKFRSGQYITISYLEKKLEMSRTPIREAFLRLLQENIIQRNGKSYFITYPEADTINQIYELRRELEAFSAYLAAIRITDRESEQMLKVLAEYEAMEREEVKPIEISKVNSKFHLLIAKISGNEYLESELRGIRTSLSVIKILPLVNSQNRHKETYEHLEIGKAIIGKNPEEARRLMFQHETNAWNYVKENIIPIIIQ